MPPTALRRTRPHITLRPARWQAECLARGLATDAAKAAAFGVDRGSVIRIQNGETAVGAVFVAAVLTTLKCRFEDVFEAVR